MGRPYSLAYKGEHFMVEAASAADAVRHVVGADVTELRPARAAEVTAWYRSGKTIAVAGGRPVPVADAERAADAATATDNIVLDLSRDDWDASAARTWLFEHGIGEHPDALAAWDRARAEGRMTLEHFDAIRVSTPVLAEAIGDFGAAVPAENIAQVRASLEENPMPFAEALHALYERWRREPRLGEEAPASEAQ